MAKGDGDTATSTTNLGKKATKVSNKVLNEVLGLVKGGEGFNPYPGQPYTDMSGQTVAALNQMEQLAGQGNPFYQGAADFTSNLIGGGLNHDTSGLEALYGQNPNAIATYGTGIASGAEGANALDQYGRQIASGALGINTEGDYRDLLGRVDPEFENVVQATANDIGDQIQRQFGGASYGSASNADFLTKGIGDVVSQMRSANFYNNLNAQRGILGDITGLQGQNIANQLGAASALSGEQMGNIGQQLQAMGMLSGEQQAGFNNNRGILGDIANLNQQSIQNQMAGVQMAPSVYAQQYLPAQMLASVGGAYDAQANRELQALMDQYNIGQQAPWNRAQAAANILIGGAGQNGATTQQTTQQASNPLGSIAGGTILLSQLLSDARFKEDIKRVGTLDNGLGVYTYRYKGSPTFHMGVMAQEALGVSPEAVANINGILAVDYSKVA